MKEFRVEKPTRIRTGGHEKLIRAGETVKIDGRRKDFYSAYPIVISADVAERYFGIEAEKPEIEETENDGS